MTDNTDIHCALMMNPNDFGDPLTFYLAPSAGQIFHLISEIYQPILDGLAQNCAQIFVVPR